MTEFLDGQQAGWPARRAAYERDAQGAFEEVAAPMVERAIQALAGYVVNEAERATATYANVVADAEAILAQEDGIGDQAARYLQDHERHIRAQMDKLTDWELGMHTAEGPANYRLAQSSKPTGRVDLGGNGFAYTEQVMRLIANSTGLQNQLWTTMAKQQNPSPPAPQS